MTPDTQLYIGKNNQQEGPYSLNEVEQKLAAGLLSPTDLCWAAGMAEWAPLSTVVKAPDAALAAPAASVPVLSLGGDTDSPPVGGPISLQMAPASQGSSADIYAAPKAVIRAPSAFSQQEKFGGLRRLPYLGFLMLSSSCFGVVQFLLFPNLGKQALDTSDSGMMYSVSLLVFLSYAVSIYLACLRVKNVGMNFWKGLLILVPFVNIWITFRCFFCQEGWVVTRKLDKPGKIWMIVFLTLLIGSFVFIFVMLSYSAGFRETFQNSFEEGIEQSKGN
jgi:GYF domain 2